jgi:hypothetical protein
MIIIKWDEMEETLKQLVQQPEQWNLLALVPSMQGPRHVNLILTPFQTNHFPLLPSLLISLKMKLSPHALQAAYPASKKILEPNSVDDGFSLQSSPEKCSCLQLHT